MVCVVLLGFECHQLSTPDIAHPKNNGYWPAFCGLRSPIAIREEPQYYDHQQSCQPASGLRISAHRWVITMLNDLEVLSVK